MPKSYTEFAPPEHPSHPRQKAGDAMTPEQRERVEKLRDDHLEIATRVFAYNVDSPDRQRTHDKFRADADALSALLADRDRLAGVVEQFENFLEAHRGQTFRREDRPNDGQVFTPYRSMLSKWYDLLPERIAPRTSWNDAKVRRGESDDPRDLHGPKANHV